MKNKKIKKLYLNNRILEAGLRLDPTLNAIKEEAEKLNINFEDVNMCDIHIDYNVNCARVWLIHYTNTKENGRNYQYFNNSHAIEIPLYLEDKETHLYNLLKIYRASLGEHYCPAKGYFIAQATDNKPQTLKKIKSYYQNAFICFCAWNGYSFKTFTLDEEEKETRFKLIYNLGHSFNRTEAIKARKEAIKIFVILNNADMNEARRKHDQRQREKLNISELERYTKKDIFNYNCGFISPSYTMQQTATGYIYTSVSFRGYSFKLCPEYNGWGKEQQQNYIFENCFDKNGYFILNKTENLKRRAEKIKKEKERATWENMSKDSFIKYIEDVKKVIKEKYIYINSLDLFVNFHLVQHLTALKELYNNFDKIANNLKENKYLTFADYQQHIKKYNNYIKIELLLLNEKNINNAACGSYKDYEITFDIVGNIQSIKNYYDWHNYATPQL